MTIWANYTVLYYYYYFMSGVSNSDENTDCILDFYAQSDPVITKSQLLFCIPKDFKGPNDNKEEFKKAFITF